MIRQATWEDHQALKNIAKQSKHTRDFSNRIFSGPDCYEAGRIRLLEEVGLVVGLTCFRKRKRDRVLVLYFIAVDSSKRGAGIGRRLMEDLWEQASGTVELKVAKENEDAVRFYKPLGYRVVGEAYNGTGWLMQKKNPR